MSDQKVAKILHDRGLIIARRTSIRGRERAIGAPGHVAPSGPAAGQREPNAAATGGGARRSA
jgi:hypothetical protein